MIHPISADDIEPLDARERCETAWGPHHIGRFEEGRAELALLFDPRWLPTRLEAELEESVWRALRRFDGHLHGWSIFGSPPSSDEQLFRLLCDHVEPARCFDVDPRTPLIVAVVDLAPKGTLGIDRVLRHEPSYVGYGNMSWPSDFRAVVYSELSYT